MCYDKNLGINCLATQEDGTFEYNQYVTGDGIARVREFERQGKRNIVLGGTGEAEINVKWDYKKTKEHLIDVAEQCGYVVNWNDADTQLHIACSGGEFTLRFENNKLKTVVELNTMRVEYYE
jgi:hypothetical protein